MVKNIVVLSLLIASTQPGLASNYTEEDALSIDKAITQDIQFQFPNDNNIHPDTSDFEVINYVTLSNEQGTRKATVTLHNSSSGNRIFVSKQIMALFANGDRLSPIEKKVTFKGKETQTITLHFGNHSYPILSLYTRQ
ncbi:hypothetical protein [Kangiella koreensis]|uniref:Uncharacterized protein n=1 Tax=Kangiella koreensis (strain DSM 16069 / JCM 12317 / KCTC 12182 / SW-125) TaxID=523791 RepID=C7RCV9_KANKD|nr:hypothetical protein [Kangiella koreensis]ACV27101.1 conserved hypothetical protein [Kangiella koreensis DSM 16069]